MRVQSLLDQKEDHPRIAAEVGTSKEYLLQLAYGHRKAGHELAKKIERATNGKTTRHELRPDIYESAA